MDCSLPGSSIHEILQARILEWVAISFPRAPVGEKITALSFNYRAATSPESEFWRAQGTRFSGCGIPLLTFLALSHLREERWRRQREEEALQGEKDAGGLKAGREGKSDESQGEGGEGRERQRQGQKPQSKFCMKMRKGGRKEEQQNRTEHSIAEHSRTGHSIR